MRYALIHGNRYRIIDVQVSPNDTAVCAECNGGHVNICLNIRISADDHRYFVTSLHKYGLMLTVAVIRNDRAVKSKTVAAIMIYR